MAADIDIERVGFPIDDRHGNAQFVRKLVFGQQSRCKEEVGFALTGAQGLTWGQLVAGTVGVNLPGYAQSESLIGLRKNFGRRGWLS